MNEALRSQVAIPLSFLFPPHGSAALEKALCLYSVCFFLYYYLDLAGPQAALADYSICSVTIDYPPQPLPLVLNT